MSHFQSTYPPICHTQKSGKLKEIHEDAFKAQLATKVIEDNKNYVNHILQPLPLSDLNPADSYCMCLCAIVITSPKH